MRSTQTRQFFAKLWPHVWSTLTNQDDYECPEEDEEEEPEAPQGAAPAPADKNEALNEAYVLGNKVAYLVPFVGPDMKGPGRIRDYGEVIVVENETVLGQMKNPKSWPDAKDISTQAVVIIKGRHTEGEELKPGKEHGPFGWYARVVHKGNLHGPDRKILRLIPKTVVKALKAYLSKHPHYNRTSLIADYQPEFDNAKEFPVAINEWEDRRTIKSESVPQKRAPKDPDKKPQKLESEAIAGSPSATVGSPSVRAPVEKEPAKKAPTAAAKPEKKGPMLNFTKVKPRAASPPAAPPAAEMAPAPAAAPAAEKKALKKRAEPEPAAEQSSSSNADVEDVSQSFVKRVRRVEVADEKKTDLKWMNGTLYIMEFN